jgi:hypothetical protein
MTQPKPTRPAKHPLPSPGARKPARYTFTDWACL